MKRYYMSASNGSVVPHESESGAWVRWEEVEEAFKEYINTIDKQEIRLVRIITESTDILHDEVARRIVADKRIKELEKALEPIRGVWTRYDDYPMFGPSGAEYAEAVKRCMWILEKEVSDG